MGAGGDRSGLRSTRPNEVPKGGGDALAGFGIFVRVAVLADREDRLVQQTGRNREGRRRARWGKLLLGGARLGWDRLGLIHGAAGVGRSGPDCKTKRTVNGACERVHVRVERRFPLTVREVGLASHEATKSRMMRIARGEQRVADGPGLSSDEIMALTRGED